MHYYMLEVRVVDGILDDGVYVGTWSSFAENLYEAEQLFKRESGFVPPAGKSYSLSYHPLRQNGWVSHEVPT